MKLLIVDDQQSAIQGLMEGIHWEDIGITEVVSAQNAMEARLVFRSGTPQIMLCDIEMPVESGIDLCRWVRDNNFPTRIIFLTCHADFEYAKDGIQLGAVDYILQPAPYDQIETTLQRVMRELRSSDEQQELLEMGEMYQKRRLTIRSSILRNYLNGGTDLRTLDAIADYFTINHGFLLVLVQIFPEADSKKPNWNDGLMLSALASFTEDIFTPEQYLTLTASVQPNTFCILLQEAEKDSHVLTEDEVLKGVQYLHDVFSVYMPYRIACYLGTITTADYLSNIWARLISQRDANVAKQSGVFSKGIMGQQLPQKTGEAELPVLHWKMLLSSRNWPELQSNVLESLDSMVQENQMDANVLLSFYRDFMQMLIDSIGTEIVMDFFDNPTTIDIYRNGMKSVDDMKELVRYVIIQGQTKIPITTYDHQQVVAKITAHIQKNISSNLRIDDLAKQVYLSSDHLTRIFKKETGETLKAYITKLRMLEAQKLLHTTQLPVSHIAAKLGYNNFSHFSTAYKKEMGISPQGERHHNYQ